MKTVKLSGRFGLGLHADSNNVLECAKEMLNINENEGIFIDFSKADFLYPSGINILLIIGKHLQITKRCKIRQNFPENPEVKNFLVESGFSEEAKVKIPVDKSIPPHNGKYIYKIRQFGWPDDYHVEELIKVIEEELALSDKVRLDAHENLTELILNVQQHSRSPIHCFIIGQGYTKTNRVRFCIGDAGISIKNHLGAKYSELLNKDAVESIEKALIEGITGAPGNQNSGVGLSYFRKFVHTCGGSFTILSNNGLYSEEAGILKPSIKKRTLDFEFPGTLIDFTISSSPGWKLFRGDEKIPKEFRLIK